MAAIARPPASGAPIWGARPVLTPATPTSAETTLPPITAHGWASGLAGRQNSSTAEAPIGAISHRPAAPPVQVHSTPVRISARKAATLARHCSRRPGLSGGGSKAVSQAARGSDMGANKNAKRQLHHG